MPRGVHNNPFVGWNPPAEESAWARAEAERRGVKLSTILTEALSEYRAKHQNGSVSPPQARKPERPDGLPAAARFVAAEEPQQAACPHPKGRIHKGLCGACGTNVGTKNGEQ